MHAMEIGDAHPVAAAPATPPRELTYPADLSVVEDLQQIVDDAGTELGYPVALEDRNLRLLAFSAHEERDIDPVRASTILKRVNADVDVIAWFRAHGALEAERPTRIPRNAALGLRARVCAPVRCQEHLLGYLWLTDEHEATSDAQLARMAQIAESAGVVIYRERLLRHLDRSRERELLRDILSDNERVRQDAALQLIDLQILDDDGPVAMIVVPLAPPAEASLPDTVRVAVDAAVARVRRRMMPKRSLHLVRPDHAALLVSLGEPIVRERGLSTLAEQMLAEIAPALDDASPRRAAVGGAALALSSARTSYEQAVRAAHVAGTVGGPFGDIVMWEELGIYQLLVELPVEQLGVEAIHPGVRLLMERPATHFLLRTLEVYLDLAGDAQATAAELHVHRTTLHHRLRRIQELAGVNLRSGDVRLALHLSLKIAHLRGEYLSTSDG